MADTQLIPWKRISVEAIAIVASILLAFAIDAGWEDRQSNIARRDLIQGLASDFESLIDRTDRALAISDDILARNMELLQLLATDDRTDLDTLKGLLSSFLESSARLRTSLPILDTAFGSEGLGNIEDPGFLRAVRDFLDQRENYERLWIISSEIFYRDFGPYYRQRFGSIAAIRSQYGAMGGFLYPLPPEFALTADQLVAEFRKPELYGRLEHRYNTNRNIRFFMENIRETADAVLLALEDLE